MSAISFLICFVIALVVAYHSYPLGGALLITLIIADEVIENIKEKE